nr:MAG TPA: Protein of unknown function (DUF551) [Caudoviricetes sp.]
MDEYIKRKEAILTVKGYAKHAIDKGRKCLDAEDDTIHMCDEIDRLLAVDVISRPRWIPADEELPPEGVDVLCWYEYFRYGLYNRMYQTFGIGCQFNGNWGGEVARGRDAKVLAWMPLPKPPEMDGGSDNG